MFPRMVSPGSPRPRARRVIGATGLVASLVWWSGGFGAGPAFAETDLSFDPGEVVSGDPGSTLTIATETIPGDLVGEECRLQVVAANGSSVHPGNVLTVKTGDSVTVIEGVEESAEESVTDVHSVTLGDTMAFDLTFGSDGLSSLDFTVTVDCAPFTTTTTEAPVVAVETTEAPTTTSTAPPATTEPTVAATVQEAPATSELPVAAPAEAIAGSPNYTG